MNELLSWYADKARQLPWRTPVPKPNEQLTTPDPYKIWVSEIMLQQTRVETVIPYFERWIERFPTIYDLAASPLEDVLAAWEGLGYYSRARNLHRGARIIVDEYEGELPDNTKKLRSLPGIGRYTAGAIASIAFGLDEPALDGNIRRVLSRYFNVKEPAGSPKGEQILWQLAADHLPKGQAGAYNQALMDLGAMICMPGTPDCAHCPINNSCQVYKLGIQKEIPTKVKKAPVPHHTVTAAVIERNGKLLIAQRPLDGLLGGMWEFPGGKVQSGESLQNCLRREIREELGVDIFVKEQLGEFQHAYTHFRITLHAFKCCLINGNEPHPFEAIDLKWAAHNELKDFPMGKIDRMISRRIARSDNVPD